MAHRETGPDAPAAITPERFNDLLFGWSEHAGRGLEIRGAATAWEILVAEVMSHQTQIGRVGPTWRRFITRWPTPSSLAEAPTQELLAAWAGLGYNRRALALREAARRIVSAHDGEVPADVDALDALPGIGPYTARAVAAAAFGTPVAPLDVNVRRVVARVTGTQGHTRAIQAVADGLVARDAPRRWFDAVTDLAAGICTAARPGCDRCPVWSVCATRGAVDPPAAGSAVRVPFPETRRWLRGRLLAIVTHGVGRPWVPIPSELGIHTSEAIASAAAELEREGFLEVSGGMARVRR